LIENDYFCSVLLEYLATVSRGQFVFKGGTCLTKVYAGFYRLSEDLDFVIPTPVNATRSERSKRAEGMKKIVDSLSRAVACFRTVEPLRGGNKSTQYIGGVSYVSLISGQAESIKIEIGLREPLLTPTVEGKAETVLIDPVSVQPAVPAVSAACISLAEGIAEKFRAGLTRREVAIRDFYDIDHAVRILGIHVGDATLVKLVAQKLAVPGNDPVNVSPARLAELRGQLEARLRPVLRERELEAFSLERAFAIVTDMARAVEKQV
jgi:predicted nucleotidyltransferase component of viral defense system